MRYLLALALAPIVLLTGCQSRTLVRVNLDGTGSIEVTTLTTPEALEQLKSGVKVDGKPCFSMDPPAFMTEEDAKSKAGEYGEGVTFVSLEKLKKVGWEGVKATYSFSDVSKVRVGGDAATQKDRFAFRWAKGPDAHGTLTVLPPAPRKTPSIPSQTEGANPGLTYSQTRAIFAGTRIEIAVEVAGRIVQTNADFVAGSTVTLLEYDMDQFLDEEDRLLAAESPKTLPEAEKLVADMKKWIQVRRAMQGGMSLHETKKALEGVKGLKLPFQSEISIEFAPK